jgi:hypothetical protein
MSRTFLLVSATEPEAAAELVASTPAPPDLCVVGPSAAARKTAAYALGGRSVFTVEDPLLAARVPAESGADVPARLAQSIRDILAYAARSPLVVCDRLDVLGASGFALDEDGLMRLADDLERALPLP